MKYISILIFFMTGIFFVSCENGQQEVFSIDRCVGEYTCNIDGQTFMVLPGGWTGPPPDVPISNYPKNGNLITVTKTGESELTLTLTDRVMVAQVDETGSLTIPDATIYMKNENVTMTLTAEYPAAYITRDMLYLKQVATGEASCDNKGNKFTLTVTNTQFFRGEK